MKFLTTIASWFAPKETDLQVALAQKNPHVHWLPAGASEDGQTEGWYFSDEVEQLHGPYDTYEIAVAYFHTYCESELRARVPGKIAPTLAETKEAKMRECIAFFACCIKSGESWTARCEEVMNEALR